jgi:GH18 family chitinase
MSTCESNEKRLDCKLDGNLGDLFAAGKRDDMRFEVNKITKNTNCLEPEKGWDDRDKSICKPNGIEDDAFKQAKAAEQSFKDHRQFFIDHILPLQVADKAASTYDDKADSLWDDKTDTFWTWQSPFAIYETCKAMAESKIGGQFIFAIGQDSSDLVHIKAYQKCMKETYLKDQTE